MSQQGTDERPNGPEFIKVPTELLRDRRLSPGAKLLLGRIACYIGKKPNGICWASQETLADELGIKPRQVRNLLSELRECGRLEWRRTKRGSCHYRVLDRQYSAAQEGEDDQERQLTTPKSGNLMPEGAAINCLQKDVLKEDFIKEEMPSSASPVALSKKKTENPLWNGLERLIRSGIDFDARRRISKALAEQAYDLEQFTAYLEQYPPKGKNPVGVVISKAKTFAEEAAGFRLEKCQVCYDTGRTDEKNRLRRSVTAPCSYCEEGKLALAQDEAAIAQQCRAAEKCASCYGRGYVNGDICSSCNGSGKTVA